MSLWLAVGKILAPAALLASGAVAAAGSDSAATTPLELAIAERACGVIPYSSVTEPDDDNPCVRTQLTALRADFGRNLSGLSPRERRGFDGACSRLNTPLSRDRYLDCLNTELGMLRKRRQQSAASAQVNPRASLEPATSRAPTPRKPSVLKFVLLLAGGAAAVFTAGGAALVIVRRRNALGPSATSDASA